MTTLLHLDSSPRGDRSKSRQLASEFVDSWKELHPDNMVVYRDLRQVPVPHVTEEWIVADFTPPEALTPELKAALQFSDELVDEFLAVDQCVFSVPMYNFSIPSNFKAYIDQIVRVGRTFKEEHGQFEGLAKGKKVLFITTRGADYRPGAIFEGLDCQESALRIAFQFMGIANIQFIHASNMDLGADARQRGLSEARSEIQKLVANW